MQNVLSIKERLETQAKTEYAEANNRLSIEEDAIRRLMRRLDSYQQQAKVLEGEKLEAADYDDDGNINAGDAVLILRKTVGLI